MVTFTSRKKAERVFARCGYISWRSIIAKSLELKVATDRDVIDEESDGSETSINTPHGFLVEILASMGLE